MERGLYPGVAALECLVARKTSATSWSDIFLLLKTCHAYTREERIAWLFIFFQPHFIYLKFGMGVWTMSGCAQGELLLNEIDPKTVPIQAEGWNPPYETGDACWFPPTHWPSHLLTLLVRTLASPHAAIWNRPFGFMAALQYHIPADYINQTGLRCWSRACYNKTPAPRHDSYLVIANGSNVPLLITTNGLNSSTQWVIK